MAYIIENANVLQDAQFESTSLLIKEGRIAMLRSSMKRLSFIRFDAKSYVMSPTHILFKPNIPQETSFQQMKEFYLNELINKGCTLFLTYAEVEKEYLLKAAIKNSRKALLNSPVDYVIGIKVPLRLITPSFIRACKREKIPVIFVELTDIGELEKIPWGWIREAMFPYNSPLIPIFKETSLKNQKGMIKRWKGVLEKEKIPFIEEGLIPDQPIPHPYLCKLGIYPVKLGIQQGGEVTYNLYQLADSKASMQSELYTNFSDRLVVTVHKGTVIRAGKEVLFRPGYGEHVMIKTPSFFTMV